MFPKEYFEIKIVTWSNLERTVKFSTSAWNEPDSEMNQIVRDRWEEL